MPKLVRADIVFDYERAEDVKDFVEVYPDLLQSATEKRFDANIRPHLESELAHEPRPAVRPWPFVTEKSRRYYMVMVRKGLIKTVNGHYVRTHNLSKGWTIRIIHSDNAIAMSTANRMRYQQFVTGRAQQPGHEQTGWVLSKKTIDFGVVAALEEIPKAAADVVKRGIF